MAADRRMSLPVGKGGGGGLAPPSAQINRSFLGNLSPSNAANAPPALSRPLSSGTPPILTNAQSSGASGAASPPLTPINAANNLMPPPSPGGSGGAGSGPNRRLSLTSPRASFSLPSGKTITWLMPEPVSDDDVTRYTALLRKGISVKKYGRSGKPHSAVIKVSDDWKTVSWADSKKVAFRSCTDVVSGRKTPVFVAHFTATSALVTSLASFSFFGAALSSSPSTFATAAAANAAAAPPPSSSPTAKDAAATALAAGSASASSSSSSAAMAGGSPPPLTAPGSGVGPSGVAPAGPIPPLRGDKELEDRCFSLVFPDRTLDCELETKGSAAKERDDIVRAFRWARDHSVKLLEGLPTNVRHITHVNNRFQWSGENLEALFELREKLGEGAFGSVYRAVHKTVGFELAVKTITAGDPEAIADIRHEMNMLQKCKNNYIVGYYGCWGPDSQKRLWILMDYCAVGSIVTLQNVIRTDLSEPQIAFVMHCTLLALVYLNSQKIIHRDVKGRNILLTADGDVKLADFGVSSTLKDNNSAQPANTRSMSRKRLELAEHAHSGDLPLPPKPPTDPDAEAYDDGGAGIAGSPLWMAPEVCTTARASYKSDIWSLGITALEIAENRLPHSEMNNAMRIMRAITTSPPPTLTPKRWSAEFNAFVNRCLTKDAAQRPDAFELLSHPFLKIASKQPGTPLSTSPALVPIQTRAVLKPLLDTFFAEKARENEPAGDGEGADTVNVTMDEDGKMVEKKKGDKKAGGGGGDAKDKKTAAADGKDKKIAPSPAEQKKIDAAAAAVIAAASALVSPGSAAAKAHADTAQAKAVAQDKPKGKGSSAAGTLKERMMGDAALAMAMAAVADAHKEKARRRSMSAAPPSHRTPPPPSTAGGSQAPTPGSGPSKLGAGKPAPPIPPKVAHPAKAAGGANTGASGSPPKGPTKAPSKRNLHRGQSKKNVHKKDSPNGGAAAAGAGYTSDDSVASNADGGDLKVESMLDDEDQNDNGDGAGIGTLGSSSSSEGGSSDAAAGAQKLSSEERKKKRRERKRAKAAKAAAAAAEEAKAKATAAAILASQTSPSNESETSVSRISTGSPHSEFTGSPRRPHTGDKDKGHARNDSASVVSLSGGATGFNGGENTGKSVVSMSSRHNTFDGSQGRPSSSHGRNTLKNVHVIPPPELANDTPADASKPAPQVPSSSPAAPHASTYPKKSHPYAQQAAAPEQQPPAAAAAAAAAPASSTEPKRYPKGHPYYQEPESAPASMPGHARKHSRHHSRSGSNATKELAAAAAKESAADAKPHGHGHHGHERGHHGSGHHGHHHGRKSSQHNGEHAGSSGPAQPNPSPPPPPTHAAAAGGKRSSPVPFVPPKGAAPPIPAKTKPVPPGKQARSASVGPSGAGAAAAAAASAAPILPNPAIPILPNPAIPPALAASFAAANAALNTPSSPMAGSSADATPASPRVPLAPADKVLTITVGAFEAMCRQLRIDDRVAHALLAGILVQQPPAPVSTASSVAPANAGVAPLRTTTPPTATAVTGAVPRLSVGSTPSPNDTPTHGGARAPPSGPRPAHATSIRPPANATAASPTPAVAAAAAATSLVAPKPTTAMPHRTQNLTTASPNTSRPASPGLAPAVPVPIPAHEGPVTVPSLLAGLASATKPSPTASPAPAAAAAVSKSPAAPAAAASRPAPANGPRTAVSGNVGDVTLALAEKYTLATTMGAAKPAAAPGTKSPGHSRHSSTVSNADATTGANGGAPAAASANAAGHKKQPSVGGSKGATGDGAGVGTLAPGHRRSGSRQSGDFSNPPNKSPGAAAAAASVAAKQKVSVDVDKRAQNKFRASHVSSTDAVPPAAAAAAAAAVDEAAVRQKAVADIKRASEALRKLDRNDLSVLTRLTGATGPPAVRMAIEGAAIVLGAVPRAKAGMPGVLDYWSPALSLLLDPQFLTRLNSFDLSAINETIIERLHAYGRTTSPALTPSSVSATCAPAGVLWNWVRAIYALGSAALGLPVGLDSYALTVNDKPSAAPAASAMPAGAGVNSVSVHAAAELIAAEGGWHTAKPGKAPAAAAAVAAVTPAGDPFPSSHPPAKPTAAAVPARSAHPLHSAAAPAHAHALPPKGRAGVTSGVSPTKTTAVSATGGAGVSTLGKKRLVAATKALVAVSRIAPSKTRSPPVKAPVKSSY